MIHVNVRGLVVRESGNGKELIIQLRKKAGEPELAEGEPQKNGDGTKDVYWANLKEVQSLIDKKIFSEIDLAAVLMFLKDEKLY